MWNMSLPTIRDVARKAGVGTGTVSRVLNDSTQVSQDTRERVLAAIQALGYRPNQFARQLSRGLRLQTIGVMSPFITDHSYVARLRGVQEALNANASDFDLVFYHVNSLERFQHRLMAIVEQGVIMGLIIMVVDLSEAQRDMLRRAGIDYVGVGDRVVEDWSFIGVDNVNGGELATQYLIDLGHRRIAYVGDSFPDKFGFVSSVDRLHGYKQALVRHRIELKPDYVKLGVHGRDEAYRLTLELLRQDEPPTAIFAMSDVQALGCMAAIRDMGLSVPGDISLIGFDDIEISYLIGLTTVRQHLKESGYRATEYLLHLLNSSGRMTPPPLPHLPPLEIVERRTTAPYHQ